MSCRKIIVTIAAAIMVSKSVSAADFTWGGGSSFYSDRTQVGWNGGPPVAGDIVRIKSGVLTCDHKDQLKGRFVYISNSGEVIVQDYQGLLSLLSFEAGGKLTIKRDAHYNNYGAMILPDTIWVIGHGNPGAQILSAGGADHDFINLSPITTFKVFDLTGNDGADLTVSAPLADGTDMAAGTSWVPSSLVKDDGGTLLLSGVNTYSGTTTIKAGTLMVNGSLSGGAVSVDGGTLGGLGTVGGTVTSDGIVSPGEKIGKLTLKSGYTQNAGGSLSVEIAGVEPGSQHDVLSVDGTVQLNGTLKVTTSGLSPSAGQRFTILNAGSISGAFTNSSLPALPEGLSWNVKYNPSSVVLEIVATTAP
jgi:autotransporter-associated beta strand protein